MAEICSGVVESDGSQQDSISRAARRRRKEIRRTKFISNMQSRETHRQGMKRRKIQINASAFSSECDSSDADKVLSETLETITESPVQCPKFSLTSVCGRRRDMEDAVAIHPSFCMRKNGKIADFHYFGVFDGHGCSHVAMKCKERFHELVREELMEKEGGWKDWKKVMERSFNRMDKEAIQCKGTKTSGASCRCELQAPECDAVGSTAVVSVITPQKIIVANCGDSRAVLCRNGRAIPLSSDHKPDRPDELSRIEAAGGRVIYWDSARVLGVLAMSRAIGDNYLKPYVICEPEVTIMDRTDEDECLILASDGLWDMVSNEVACTLARMCLRGKALPESSSASAEVRKFEYDASMLLTKVALSKHSSDNISVVVIDLRKEKEKEIES